MGYKIIIGELILDDSDPDSIRYTVEITEDATAPIFSGDYATHNTNVRKPKYSAWADFLHETDLYELFMDEEVGLMRQHPGVQPIDEEHLHQVNAAYLLRCAFVDKQPGWEYQNPASATVTENSTDFDPHLARLGWLRFWMRWALDNCKSPSIYNG